jgi:hypothetical protein
VIAPPFDQAIKTLRELQNETTRLVCRHNAPAEDHP